MANENSQTSTGVAFAEAKMARCIDREVLLVDINGGVDGVIDGLDAMTALDTDLLVGLDVGGDSLAEGQEPGLRSPLADSIMLAALAELERRGRRTIWGVFGFGSDGELTVDEIELALSKLGAAGALLGAWSLTPKIAAELETVIQTVPTEASAIPVQCFRGAWGVMTSAAANASEIDAAHRTDFLYRHRQALRYPRATCSSRAPEFVPRRSQRRAPCPRYRHRAGLRTEILSGGANRVIRNLSRPAARCDYSR